MESTLIIILLAASLIFNIVTMILVIGLVKKNKSMNITEEHYFKKTIAEEKKQYADETGVVFCRNCGNQFDSTLKVCPDCKTPR